MGGQVRVRLVLGSAKFIGTCVGVSHLQSNVSTSVYQIQFATLMVFPTLLFTDLTYGGEDYGRRSARSSGLRLSKVIGTFCSPLTFGNPQL